MGVGCGTVFKLTNKGSGWVFTPLNFQGGNDGSNPFGRVAIGQDGSLYGTTTGGGGSGCGGTGCGTVFNLRPQPRACNAALCPWTETDLYRFTGSGDGEEPSGDIIFDEAGNLYGVAGGGAANCNGYGCGVVYELIRSNTGWTQTVLYSFTGSNDGGFPGGGVTFDRAGNLYGVASQFGANNDGTVYELTPSGLGWVRTLFSFQTGASKWPRGNLIFDQFGNLYGTTTNDRFNDGGTTYKLTESNGSWGLASTLYLSPEAPEAGFTMGPDGNLYGTAVSYKGTDCGIVFKTDINFSNFTVLYYFSGSNGNGPEGCDPESQVLFDASGNLYGTTVDGGAYGYGVVWEITP